MADLWDDFDDAGEIATPPAPRAAAPAVGGLWDDFDAPASAPTVVVREPESLGPVSTVLRDAPRTVLGSRAAAEDRAAAKARDVNAVAQFLGRPLVRDPRAQFVDEIQSRLAPIREGLELTRVQRNAPGVFAGETAAPTLGERVEDLGISLRDSARSLTSGVAGLPVNWINAVNRSANIGADALAGLFGQDAQDIEMLGQPGFVQYLGEELPAVGAQELEELGSDRLQRERQELQGKGFLDTIGQVVTHPTTLADQVGAQASNIATAGLGGGVQARLLAQGLSAAGQNAQQVEAELRQRYPDMDEQELRRRVADVFTGSLASETLIPSIVPGGAAIERALARQGGERSLAGVVGATLGEAVAGGGTEATQQISQNVALGDDPLAGVGQAAGLGTLLDAGPGAVAGLSMYGAERAAAAAGQPSTPLAPAPAPPPVMDPADEAVLQARLATVQPAAAAGDQDAALEAARISDALAANEAAKVAAVDAQRAAEAQTLAEVAAGVAAPPAGSQSVLGEPAVEQPAAPRETIQELGADAEPLPVIGDDVFAAFEGAEPAPRAVEDPAPAGTAAGRGAAPGLPAAGSTPSNVVEKTEPAPPADFDPIAAEAATIRSRFPELSQEAAERIAREPEQDQVDDEAPEYTAADFMGGMDSEVGWTQRGGELLRDRQDGDDSLENFAGRPTGAVVGRTEWVAKPSPAGGESRLWRERPDQRLKESEAREALEKAAAGDKLSPIEQRFVDHATAIAQEYADIANRESREYREDLALYDAADLVRQRRSMREQVGDLSDADADLALTIDDLVHRAYAGGATPEAILDATFDGTGAQQARALWTLIAELESENRGQEQEQRGRAPSARASESREAVDAPALRTASEGKAAPEVAPDPSRLVQGDQDPELVRGLGSARARGVTVAKAFEDLPADVRARLPEDLATAEGFYDPETGRAYVIESNLGKPSKTGMSRTARKIWVAAHERTGHAGLRGSVVGKVGANMLRVLDEAARNPTVQDLAAAIAGKGQGRTDRELANAPLLVEEALAELAAATQTGNWRHLEERYGVTVPAAQRNTIRGLIARLVDAIKQAFGLASVNDAAIYQLLRDANRYAATGQVARTRRTPAPAERAPGADDVHAPNFGAKPWPKPLDDNDPLLRETFAIDTPERQALRDSIVDAHFEGVTPAPAGRRPIAYVMGGGGASGKGTLLRQLVQHEVVPAENLVHIDPDAIKTGDGVPGLPEYAELVRRGDSRAAAVVHEESSSLAGQVRARAIEGRYDMVLDRTLGNPEKAARELQQLHNDGYEVRLYGITIDPATAIPRAVQRAERSGRYVPIGAMLEAHQGFAEGFEQYLPYVDQAVLYDNSGNFPVRIGALEGGQFVISDGALYDEFARRRGINVKATTVAEILNSGQDQNPQSDQPRENGDAGPGREAPGRVRSDDRRSAESRDGRAPARGQGQAEKVTDTAAFKRWFGNSVVVNSKGEPLVVYRGEHGADTSLEVQTNIGSYTFTDDPRVASFYAQDPNDSRMRAELPRVTPAYLRIENPIFNNTDDPFVELSWLEEKFGRDEAVRIARKFADNIEYTGNWMEDLANEFDSVDEMMDAAPERVGDLYFDAFRYLDDQEEMAKAKAAGFDGAVHIGNGESASAIEYRVFDRSQIKSAIANAEFDPNSDSILASQAPTQAAPSTTPDVRTSYDVAGEATIRDRIRSDLAETMQDLATIKGGLRSPKRVLESVNRFRSLIFDSAQSRARDLEAKFPKSQALRELFDIYFEAPGYNRLVRETLPSAIESRRNVFLSRVERHLEARGLRLGKMTKQENEHLRNALLGFPQGVPDNIVSAADLIRHEMNIQRQDALAAGVDIGEVTDIGYLTRLYDDDAILADEAGFLRDAAAHMTRYEFVADVGRPRDVLYGDGTFARFIAALRRAAVDHPHLQQQLDLLRDLAKSYRNSSNVRGEAEQIKQIVTEIYGEVARHYGQQRAQTWLHAIKTPDISHGFNGLLESGAPVTRERSLVGAADITLKDWMRTDVREILNAYGNSISTKVEEARRVGTDPSYLKGLLDRASREGVDSRGLEDAVDILSSVTGSRVSKNATFQGFQEVASAWTYLALLGRGLFASIAEPATFAIRTGQLRHALAPVIIAGRSIARLAGNDTNRALQRLAVDIGVNGHRAVEDTLLNNGGGDYTSRFWRGAVTKFFRGIWLTQLTEAQRAYGVGASVGYLKGLARGVLEGEPEASIYLNELGIADHRDFAEWILQQGARPAPVELFDADGRPTPRGQDFMVATRRLVNQSIQAVQPQHRTQWQNSPGGRIFSAIMGYSMAAYTNVIRREFNLSRTLRREIGSGAQGRRAAVFLAAATALYVNVLVISTLREALFNQARFEDKDEDEIAKELAQLAASRTFGFGAVDPLIQLVSNLKYKKTFAETLAGATLGTFLGDLQKVAEVFNDETNSPNTETTEFRAMEAVYRSAIAPLANMVLSRIPFVSGFAIPAVSGSNVRKWFAGLFFDRPDARTPLDDDYSAATKELANAKRKVEEDLATFPKEQWAKELRRMKAEFPTALSGARLDTYAPTPANINAGRIGPKVDENGKPKITFGKRGDKSGSLYGELEGYPQYDQGKRRWSTGEGLADQVEAANRGIAQIREAKDITLGQLYKAAFAAGTGDAKVLELAQRIKQNPDGPEAQKLAGERLQREVLEELMEGRRDLKRATIELSKRAKSGEAIARGEGNRTVERLRGERNGK